MKKLLAVIVVFIVLIACNKDKFQTKPYIKIKDYNSKVINRGGNLEVRISYTDKEGDIGKGAFYGLRVRLNKKLLSGADNDKADTLRFPIVDMEDTDIGEVIMRLEHDDLKESTTENDTIIFKVAIKDRAGHESDTIDTDRIVIVK